MKYRNIHVRLWRVGGSFRKLSGPGAPNAQMLWLYLLTGEHTTQLPGVVVAGRLALAEALGWEGKLAQFDRCLEELEAAEMILADWDSRLVFCCEAPRYNPPQSPNVIRAWRRVFDELPECPLKRTILGELETFVGTLNEGFIRAFEESFPQGYAEGLPEESLSVSVSGSGSGPVKGNGKAKVTDEDVAAVVALWSEVVMPNIDQKWEVVAPGAPLGGQPRKRIADFIRRAAKRNPDAPLEEVRRYFDMVSASDFLMGRKSDWFATLDWVVGPVNEGKVLGGRYSGRRRPKKAQDKFGWDV